MKILHVCDWYRPFGGAERLLFCVLEALEQAGHENIIIANQVPGQETTGRRPEYFVEDVEASLADMPRLSIFGHAPWIRRLRSRALEIIGRHKPDVAHIHNLQNPFLLREVARVLPTVRSIHDPRLYCFTNWRLLPDRSLCPYPMGRRCVLEGCLPKNPLGASIFVRQAPYRLLHLRAHKEVDLLIAESRAVRDCLMQNGFSSGQIAMLPNFTPTYGGWEEVQQFNARYHDSKSRTVLFVGRASPEKGLEDLVEA
ncbi:MAG: glycosyltransferase, partial [Elusimicrobia bacterium]|nr:glycosyltransferase [Elusimicrobiota bacterium]